MKRKKIVQKKFIFLFLIFWNFKYLDFGMSTKKGQKNLGSILVSYHLRDKNVENR